MKLAVGGSLGSCISTSYLILGYWAMRGCCSSAKIQGKKEKKIKKGARKKGRRKSDTFNAAGVKVTILRTKTWAT